MWTVECRYSIDGINKKLFAEYDELAEVPCEDEQLEILQKEYPNFEIEIVSHTYWQSGCSRCNC